MKRIQDAAHALLPVIGALLLAQGPIVAYASSLGAPDKVISAIFGGLGLIALVASKYIDSKSYTEIATTTSTPPA